MSEQNRSYQKLTATEMLIGTAILIALAAVVVPEFSHAGALSRSADLYRAVEVLRGEVGKYRIEHQNRLPGYENGRFDCARFWRQLTTPTDDHGEAFVSGKSRRGPFGPYLQCIVENPILPAGAGGVPEVCPVSTDPPKPLPGARFYFDAADGSGKIWAATDERGSVAD